jgi:outer membrane protein OmpA-like peptidoglycan-associated protein
MGWGTGEDERARATTPPRLAVIVTATVLGGMIAAVGVIGSNALEPRLAESAQSALRDAGIEGVDVRFDGREAFLTPVGATGAQLIAAERVVEAVDGVRWATVVAPDPAAQPTLTVHEGADGVVTVNGIMGAAGQASAVQDAAVAAFGPGTVAGVTVRDGVAVAAWTDSAPQLFAALVQVGDLEFMLSTDGATLSGSAADPSSVQAAVAAALDPIPLTSRLEQAGPTEAEAATINGTVILFIADSVTLDATAREQAAALADALRRFPTIDVTLTGHIAIPVGTEADAIAFSRERAQAVADALIADGVDASRIETDGAGSSQPVGDNATDAGAAANRRVTVLIMEGS